MAADRATGNPGAALVVRFAWDIPPKRTGAATWTAALTDGPTGPSGVVDEEEDQRSGEDGHVEDREGDLAHGRMVPPRRTGHIWIPPYPGRPRALDRYDGRGRP